MLHLYEVILVLAMCLTLSSGNSAGVGIPCETASTPAYPRLGHPSRGDLAGLDKDQSVIKMKQLDDEGYKMYWVLPPQHSTDYTVRSGDSNPMNDPDIFIPGQWMNIYVRAVEEGKKFTGLIMFAKDNQGNVVGDWKVDPDTSFRYGEDPSGVKCVTHRNAELKNYLNVFRFHAPEAGTGPITIHAIVKVGLAFPVLDGNFYYPNFKPLFLQEGPIQTQRWFEGAPGLSCDQVCNNQQMQCDLNVLSSIGSSRTEFSDIAQRFSPSCIEPIMSGCGSTSPSVGSEGCFYHDAVCGDKPIVIPEARPDPCDGLTTHRGNGRLDANQCVKWSYVRQNNGIGRDVYNQMYVAGDLVKVCCGSSSAELKDQDAFNNNMKIVDKCAPAGGYTPQPTASPPPPKQKGAITCSATDSDVRDGGRICACSGGNFPNPSPTPPTPPTPATLAPTTSPIGGPSFSGVSQSSVPNMALVWIFALLASMNQFDSMPKHLSVLSLTLSVNAHNWMSSPSRANNGFNAYQTAPCPPKGSRVHFQVKAGQLFPMEFATGHSTPARGGTYLTVLRAEDEGHMIKHTRALLDDYLESAPAGSSDYMADHKSHHVGSMLGSTTSENVRDTLSSLYGVGAQKGNIRNFGANWGNKPARNSPIYPKKPDKTMDDIRVSYKSNKYSWIVSAHKFKLHEDKSEEADLVMMEIPVGQATGQYVIQYSWNGYYDCTDVNVISDTSIDFYGAPATEIQFDKLDHCRWIDTYQDYSVLGECREIKKGESADACFNQCKNINGCYGVQVVPYKLSDQVGKKGLFQGTTSTMPQECNSLQVDSEDSLVCFPIKEGKSVVGSTYDISEDPYDSIFYGTCYIKAGAWTFLQTGIAPVVTETDKFKFGRECISCDSKTNNKLDFRVPFWEVTFGECEHCDRTVG